MKMASEVVPQLGLRSFNCPVCNALAAQTWFKLGGAVLDSKKSPTVFTQSNMQAASGTIEDDNLRKRLWDAGNRLEKHPLTWVYEQYTDMNYDVVNLYLSRCYACEGMSVWLKDELIWPSIKLEVEPHADMPNDIKEDFIEAASILKASPRGSAALSRLVVQKLMAHLGGRGKDINANIAYLVRGGLETEIQMALDIVRVTGNNAVHPGELALKEDAGTAMALLQLVNLVVERRIAVQKRIEEMFGNLPPGALEAIKKRDGESSQ
jgi:hypothetical protein